MSTLTIHRLTRDCPIGFSFYVPCPRNDALSTFIPQSLEWTEPVYLRAIRYYLHGWSGCVPQFIAVGPDGRLADDLVWSVRLESIAANVYAMSRAMTREVEIEIVHISPIVRKRAKLLARERMEAALVGLAVAVRKQADKDCANVERQANMN